MKGNPTSGPTSLRDEANRVRSTTVLCVRHRGRTVIGADGQVTHGATILKGSARKVRRLHNGKVIAGFAGGTADAFTLFERFESKLQKFSGEFVKSAVELAKDWRLDRSLRRLEAMLLVADSEKILLLSGVGDVIEPDESVASIGSGAPFALSSALALKAHSNLEAESIVRESMKIAAAQCIYTNDQLVLESLESEGVE